MVLAWDTSSDLTGVVASTRTLKRETLLASNPTVPQNMRIPIFSHRANPAVDRPICKKKLGYAESLIADGLGRWLNPAAKADGVVLGGRYLATSEQASREHKMAAGTMRAAWGMVQSGYAGPLVFQMRREQGAVATA